MKIKMIYQLNFNSKIKPQNPEKKQKKKDIYSYIHFSMVNKEFFMPLTAEYFP